MRRRRYETVFLVPPDLEEAKRQRILERLDGVIEKGGGLRVRIEDWGVRRLAYPVNHHPKGRYYLIDYVGSSEVVTELERHLRMIEDVHRFLTVKKEDRADLEAAEREREDERQKEAAREASKREKEVGPEPEGKRPEVTPESEGKEAGPDAGVGVAEEKRVDEANEDSRAQAASTGEEG